MEKNINFDNVAVSELTNTITALKRITKKDYYFRAHKRGIILVEERRRPVGIITLNPNETVFVDMRAAHSKHLRDMDKMNSKNFAEELVNGIHN